MPMETYRSIAVALSEQMREGIIKVEEISSDTSKKYREYGRTALPILVLKVTVRKSGNNFLNN